MWRLKLLLITEEQTVRISVRSFQLPESSSVVALRKF